MIAALLLLFSAADPGGYLAAKWGMTPDEVLAAIPQATRHTGPDATQPQAGTLSPIVIKEIEVAHIPMRVYFRFGEKSDRLENVLLSALGEDLTPAHFERLEALLVEKYGRPWSGGDAKERNSQWTFPTTTIRLSGDRLPLVNTWLIGILYKVRDPEPPI